MCRRGPSASAAAAPALLALLALLTSCAPEPEEGAAGARVLGSFRIDRVVDGDTVVLDDGEGTRVRLIGIDTPEVAGPRVAAECGGPAASRAATRLLRGERVEVRLDPSQGRYDTYGRTLAYLDLAGVGDVGLALLRDGHAREYTFDEAYELQDDYRSAEAAAREGRRGLWGRCR